MKEPPEGRFADVPIEVYEEGSPPRKTGRARRKPVPPPGRVTPKGILRIGSEVEISALVRSDLEEMAPTSFCDGRVVRYDTERGIWSEIIDPELREVVRRYDGYKCKSDGKTLKMSTAKIKGILADLASRLELACPDFRAGAPPVVVFANCAIVMRPDADGSPTLVTEPHNQAHKATHALPYDYDPNASRARFEAFLDSIFAGDPEEVQKRQVLQQFAGVCLFGQATRFQKALLCTGEGSNGKSVLLKIIEALFPAAARCAIAPQQFAEDTFAVRLAGKLINIMADIPKTGFRETNRFKIAADGGAYEAADKYKPSETIRPIAGHLFSANHLPPTQDLSLGFFRRYLILRFGQNFEGIEKTELEKEIIAKEMPGVAAWAIEGGAHALNKGAYTTVPSSHAEVARWRAEADEVANFAEDALDQVNLKDLDRGERGSKAVDLYAAYAKWSAKNGVKAVSNVRFSQRLEAVGKANKRRGMPVWARKRFEQGVFWNCHLTEDAGRELSGL